MIIREYTNENFNKLLLIPTALANLRSLIIPNTGKDVELNWYTRFRKQVRH